MDCDFITALSNKPDTYTENGAPTYSSTLNANLDFFSLSGSMRNTLDENEHIKTMFVNAFEEDSKLAIANLFHLRDVRFGYGERDLFRICFYNVLIPRCVKNMTLIEFLLKQIQEYGRWDDLFHFFSVEKDLKISTLEKRQIEQIIVNIVLKQLKSDLDNMKENKPISLMAKWFPLMNSVSSPTKKAQASIFIHLIKERTFTKEKFSHFAKVFRKTIVMLRNYLKIVEHNLSTKDYDSINYETIPSKALLKYTKAFLRNDEVKYTEYKEKVKSGKAKINTKIIAPYEIVNKMEFAQSNEEKDTLNTIWDNLPNYTETNGDSIVVCDVSGSMECRVSPKSSVRAIDVALSLALYFADKNHGKFGKHFISFSNDSHLVKVKGKTLSEQMNNINYSDWGNNTNLNNVFKNILKYAKEYDVPKEEMPKVIYICSDMEFDIAYDNDKYSKTNHSMIKMMYKESGYELPKIVYWNVCSRNNNLPVRKDEKDVVLVSGMSSGIFQQAIEGEINPLKFMLQVLNGERYKLFFEKC